MDLQNSKDLSIELSTFDSFDCLFFPLLSNEIEINVIAKHGIHICLFSEPNRSHNFYVIVVGGWSNTKSVIRNQKEKELVVNKSTNMINPDGSTNLLVRYDKLFNRISVAKSECKEYPLMVYNDDNSLPDFKYIGFHTEEGATGHWIINMKGTRYHDNSFKINKHLEFYSGKTYVYQYLKFNSKIIEINVQSSSDVCIRLGTNQKHYEFQIGENNTWSYLKYDNTVVSSAETIGILNKDKKTKFIIKINEHCICISEGDNKYPFLVHHSKNLQYTNQIGFCTKGVPGEWSIDDPFKNDMTKIW